MSPASERRGVRRMRPLVFGVLALLALTTGYLALRDSDGTARSPSSFRPVESTSGEPEAGPAVGSSAGESTADDRWAVAQGVRTRSQVTAADELGEVTILTRWADGEPAVGVFVAVWLRPNSGPEVVREIRTDEKGMVHFGGLPEGSIHCESSRGGYANSQLARGERLQLVLDIPAGIRVKGQVNDSLGRPIGAAQVWLSDYGSPTTGRVVASTGPDGGFELRDVPPDCSVGAAALGFLPAPQERVRGAEGSVLELEFSLDSGPCELRMYVQDPGESPVVGAEVRLDYEAVDPIRGGMWGIPTPLFAHTDAQGYLLLSCLRPGRARLEVVAPGFGPVWRKVSVEEGVQEARIVLSATALLTGTVRQPDGSPSPHARLTLTPQEGGWRNSRRTVADGEGGYAFLEAPTGAVQVEALGSEGSRGRAQCRLSPGRSDVVDIVLEAAPETLTGRVRMEDGTPCVGWRVGAALPGESRLWLTSQLTEVEGRFQLVVPGPEERVDLEVYVPEKSLWPAVVRHGLDLPQDGIEITVPAAALAFGGVAGTVLPPPGVFLDELWLSVEVQGKLDRRQIEIDPETGAFASSEIPAGIARLHLVGPTVFELLTEWKPVETGGDPARWTVEPTAAGRAQLTALLAGVEHRKPLHAELYDAAGAHVDSLTQTGSLLRSTQLQRGQYRLLTWGKEIALHESWIYVDSPQVYEDMLHLEPGTTRTFLLETVNCRKEEGLRFELFRDGELLRQGSIPEERRLELQGLEVGSYDIVLNCTGDAVWRARAQIYDLAEQAPTLLPFARDP